MDKAQCEERVNKLKHELFDIMRTVYRADEDELRSMGFQTKEAGYNFFVKRSLDLVAKTIDQYEKANPLK